MLVLMDNQALRFVDNQDIFILVNDINPVGCLGEIVFVRWLDEEFILQPYVNQITFTQFLVGCTAFSVDFDVFGTDTFVHQ